MIKSFYIKPTMNFYYFLISKPNLEVGYLTIYVMTYQNKDIAEKLVKDHCKDKGFINQKIIVIYTLSDHNVKAEKYFGNNYPSYPFLTEGSINSTTSKDRKFKRIP